MPQRLASRQRRVRRGSSRARASGRRSRGSLCVPPAPGIRPEARLWQPEARILRGEHDVAGQRELAAAAEAPTVHGRDDRQPRRAQPLPARRPAPRRAPRPATGSRKPATSAPAANARPAPQSTTQRTPRRPPRPRRAPHRAPRAARPRARSAPRAGSGAAARPLRDARSGRSRSCASTMLRGVARNAPGETTLRAYAAHARHVARPRGHRRHARGHARGGRLEDAPDADEAACELDRELAHDLRRHDLDAEALRDEGHGQDQRQRRSACARSRSRTG